MVRKCGPEICVDPKLHTQMEQSLIIDWEGVNFIIGNMVRSLNGKWYGNFNNKLNDDSNMSMSINLFKESK